MSDDSSSDSDSSPPSSPKSSKDKSSSDKLNEEKKEKKSSDKPKSTSNKKEKKKKKRSSSGKDSDSGSGSDSDSDRPRKKKVSKSSDKSKSKKPNSEKKNDKEDKKPSSKGGAEGAKPPVPEDWEQYDELGEFEHVLKRPDTFLGSKKNTKAEIWIVDPKNDKRFILSQLTYIPAFLKIFDEVLLNAADNRQRDKKMTELRVNVDCKTGKIQVYNTGKTISVTKHGKLGIYCPEMIFTRMRTGDNFKDQDDKKRTTGGRNGYGAKLAFICSTEVTVECHDCKAKKHFQQSYYNNLSKIGDAIITDIGSTLSSTKKEHKSSDSDNNSKKNNKKKRKHDSDTDSDGSSSDSDSGSGSDSDSDKEKQKKVKRAKKKQKTDGGSGSGSGSDSSSSVLFNLDRKAKYDWTCVTFTPDLVYFGMKEIDADSLNFIKRRVWDVSGTSDKALKVYFNNQLVPIAEFHDYVKGFVIEPVVDLGLGLILNNVKKENGDEKKDKENDQEEKKKKKDKEKASFQVPKNSYAFEIINDRWQIGLMPKRPVSTNKKAKSSSSSAPASLQNSFVNNIFTMNGGKHVDHVMVKVCKALKECLKTNSVLKKLGVKIDNNAIKKQLFVHVNSLIENPEFDSQTKVRLTTERKDFGSECNIPADGKLIKQLLKTNLIDRIIAAAKAKQQLALSKIGGVKGGKNGNRNRVLGQSKLDDAKKAGTSEGYKCTLILTEGESAKSLAIAGLSTIGRDYYGVFPLKGKFINVREASAKQMQNNKELAAIVTIIGIQMGQDYSTPESRKKMRYGHVMIMSDQDHDGSHIKGLIINLFAYLFPSLAALPNFLQEFITPIVKCTRGKEFRWFYTIPEFKIWYEDHKTEKGWKIKYYKGLGTSDAGDMREYCQAMDKHQKTFQWEVNGDGGAKSAELMKVAFDRDKKYVKYRKIWLGKPDPNVFLDQTVKTIPIPDFINQELKLFSHASNERSISSMIDSLKPGQRKIMFTFFNSPSNKEVKVEQFGGEVTKRAGYHHGAASLYQTMVGLAQNFVGSNNINLLEPNGMFGTRLQGGKDNASARYIFTRLTKIARVLFRKEDDDIVDDKEEDGEFVEPLHYYPVICIALVNGGGGIGTAWSTSTLNYNPHHIIKNHRLRLDGKPMEPMDPW